MTPPCNSQLLSPAMEQLGHVSPDFHPVHKRQLTMPESTPDREIRRKRISNTQPQTVTVEVPLRIPGKSKPQVKEEEAEEGSNAVHSPGCVYSRSLILNHGNFERSAEPERLMYHRAGSWINFAGEVVEKAKAAFLGRNATPEIAVDGSTYTFDFNRMLQIDVVNGFQRSISWIDVKKNCFFPKVFVDDCVDTCYNNKLPKIELEIKVESSKLTGGKRTIDRIIGADRVDTADSSMMKRTESEKPKRRCLRNSDSGVMKWPNSRLVREGEKAYLAVKNLFLRSMRIVEPSVEVTSIHQLVRNGPMERARWEVFQRQMSVTKASRGAVNAAFAWHGTSKEEVMRILSHGFGLPSKVEASKAHGIGVYLSPACSPHLSHALTEVDGNGERHVILCRVILGNNEKVEIGSEQSHPSTLKFDTGVDDIDHPNWYVVWTTNMNTHIFPECVVSYKCSEYYPQGSTQKMDLTNGVLDGTNSNMFTKLTTLLPPSKVEDLKLLWKSYTAGKLRRDSFLEEFRFIAGDRILRSVFNYIQST